jgi:dynein heavy chain 2
LSKLTDARNIVAKLKSDAGVQETKLAEKQEKANQALNMISRTMQGVNTKKEQMESLRKEFQIKNDFLNQRYIIIMIHVYSLNILSIKLQFLYSLITS